MDSRFQTAHVKTVTISGVAPTKSPPFAAVTVYVDLYSAFLRKAPHMRSDMDHTVLPPNYTMPAFTPQTQNISALWLVLILTVPRKIEG